jgi:hypothetical protein
VVHVAQLQSTTFVEALRGRGRMEPRDDTGGARRYLPRQPDRLGRGARSRTRVAHPVSDPRGPGGGGRDHRRRHRRRIGRGFRGGARVDRRRWPQPARTRAGPLQPDPARLLRREALSARTSSASIPSCSSSSRVTPTRSSRSCGAAVTTR